MLTVSVSAHIGPHLRLISSEASVHGLGANIPDRVTRQCHRTQHYDTQRPCTERLSVCRANRAILASTELELQPVASPDRPPKGGRFGDRVEDDARYNRVDLSAEHAYEARQSLLATVAKGEARMDLAEAALQIAAEDDAIASHTVVRLPVGSYRQRLNKLAQGARNALGSLPKDAKSEDQVQAVENFLWEQQRFRLPHFGRSNVPQQAKVDHPGVYEDARHAYLHEVLIRRVGCSAALAVIYGDVMQRLLVMGALNFGVRVECRDLNVLPTAEVLPGMTREVAAAGGAMLNLCSQDVLLEVLRFLKRAYWPFAWDSSGGPESGGGFRDAAMDALQGAASAELQAIAQAAAHRLERGIWTSPGAGDLRRALAATERLATIFGDRHPQERRDAGVLLLHAGHPAQALAELQEYCRTEAAEEAPLKDRHLVDQLQAYLSAMLSIDTSNSGNGNGSTDNGSGTGSTAQPDSNGSTSNGSTNISNINDPGVPPLRVGTELGRVPPAVQADRRVPLTW
mmetsp:Transcript_19795/g.59797  ORF Transcript_19795/g.59797 Transcript_19795/m.59797 type:complete len:513 (+) Transcript_19795:154-1692(+)